MTGRLPLPGSLGPWAGGPVGARAVCVLAPNPGPMTLDGTNTWVLLEPGAARAVVLDPGPDDEAHLQRVAAAVAERGARIGLVLLTHGHADHAEGARSLAQRWRAPVRALDPAHRLGEEGLADGDVVDVEGLVLRVVATPGHSGDSVSFLCEADAGLLTGDTLLGRGTTVVAHPDGRLGDYLDSLRRLRALAETTSARRVLTGHGPVLDDPVDVVDAYVAHRQERLDQVQAALAAGAAGAPDVAAAVVDAVYDDVPPALRAAAMLSVRAQLEYLAAISGSDAAAARRPGA